MDGPPSHTEPSFPLGYYQKAKKKKIYFLLILENQSD